MADGSEWARAFRDRWDLQPRIRRRSGKEMLSCGVLTTSRQMSRPSAMTCSDSTAAVPRLLSRRDALLSSACGFGWLAFNGIASAAAAPANPLHARRSHFPARAKRIIFLFMAGGVSHVDSFDY